MNKLRGRQTDTLTVGNDQMLFALPVEVDGVEETLFTTKEMQSNTREPIKLGGAWSNLNWEEAESFFQQVDRESVSSAPLSVDDF